MIVYGGHHVSVKGQIYFTTSRSRMFLVLRYQIVYDMIIYYVQSLDSLIYTAEISRSTSAAHQDAPAASCPITNCVKKTLLHHLKTPLL